MEIAPVTPVEVLEQIHASTVKPSQPSKVDSLSLEERKEAVIKYAKVVIGELMDRQLDAKITSSSCGDDSNEILLVVKADRTEIARLIGKNGDTAKALKQILRAVARKYKCFIEYRTRNNEEEEGSVPFIKKAVPEKVNSRYDNQNNGYRNNRR